MKHVYIYTQWIIYIYIIKYIHCHLWQEVSCFFILKWRPTSNCHCQLNSSIGFLVWLVTYRWNISETLWDIATCVLTHSTVNRMKTLHIWCEFTQLPGIKHGLLENLQFIKLVSPFIRDFPSILPRLWFIPRWLMGWFQANNIQDLYGTFRIICRSSVSKNKFLYTSMLLCVWVLKRILSLSMLASLGAWPVEASQRFSAAWRIRIQLYLWLDVYHLGNQAFDP